MKIGRNDPCYCGSGKKYKKCCGKTKQSSEEENGYTPVQAKLFVKSFEFEYSRPYLIKGWTRIGDGECEIELPAIEVYPFYYSLRELYYNFREIKQTERWGILVVPDAGKSSKAFIVDTQVLEKAFF